MSASSFSRYSIQFFLMQALTPATLNVKIFRLNFCLMSTIDFSSKLQSTLFINFFGSDSPAAAFFAGRLRDEDIALLNALIKFKFFEKQTLRQNNNIRFWKRLWNFKEDENSNIQKNTLQKNVLIKKRIMRVFINYYVCVFMMHNITSIFKIINPILIQLLLLTTSLLSGLFLCILLLNYVHILFNALSIKHLHGLIFTHNCHLKILLSWLYDLE